MNTFIRNIRNHKKAALICAAVLVAAAAVTVLVYRHAEKRSENEQDNRSGYFLDSEYPVYVTEKDGSLIFELDGSASADLKWQSGCNPKGIAIIADGAAEKNSKIKLTLNPGVSGYTTATFSRSGEIGGIPYDAVTITADLVASNTTESGKELHLSDIRQSTALAGAVNTDTPYLIQGNRVILPNGGDWTLTTENETDGDALVTYHVYTNMDENGHQYLAAVQSISEENRLELSDAESKFSDLTEEPPIFLLKSESLGIEQRLTLAVDSNLQNYLCKARETDGK